MLQIILPLFVLLCNCSKTISEKSVFVNPNYNGPVILFFTTNKENQINLRNEYQIDSTGVLVVPNHQFEGQFVLRVFRQFTDSIVEIHIARMPSDTLNTNDFYWGINEGMVGSFEYPEVGELRFWSSMLVTKQIIAKLS